MLRLHVLISWLIIALVIFTAGCNKGVVATNGVTKETSFSSHGSSAPTNACTYKNCLGYSIDHVLAEISRNDLINITTDATLSSVVLLANVKSVTIIGYNNPTVTCSNAGGGGLHFLSSNNLTIKGIIWHGCGQDWHQDVNSVIQFYNSSNIFIQNCSFQHSVGQVVVLSAVSGTVSIDKCNFLNNSQYKGNGTAIYYSSSETKHSQLMINDYDFSYNGGNNIVYIDQSADFSSLQDSIFQKIKDPLMQSRLLVDLCYLKTM